MTPWLTDEEIGDLCAGLKQPAAQLRYLRGLGLTVHQKPNGRPLVMRAELERVTSAPHKPSADSRQPNRQGLIATFKRAA